MRFDRFTVASAAVLCALVSLLAFAAAPSLAENRHIYQSQISEVPTVGPHGEPVPAPGPLTKSHSMTVDSGELYVTEVPQGQSVARINKFNAATGAFLGQFPQIGAPFEYVDQGVAVGHAGGQTTVYVAGDELMEGRPRGVVTVLGANGESKSVWRGTQTPAKGFRCFECSATSDVAVDNSGAGWAAGDVYVADPENAVVDVFEPETGGGEGKPVAQLTGVSPSEPFNEPYKVAVTETGEIVVADLGYGVDIFKPAALPGQYEFVGKLTSPSGRSLSRRIDSIATDDGEGDIYFAFEDESSVLEFDSAGAYDGQVTAETAPDGTFGENHIPSSLAADPITHRVYVGTQGGVPPDPVFAFGPNIVFPDVATGAASSVQSTSATLNGTVNLRKGGAASCQFEWGTSRAFDQEPARCPHEVEAEGDVPVSVELTGLQPDTTYYYRLQATNANGTNEGEAAQDVEFTTPGPGLRDESASEVASTSATLDASIDPNGHPTSYYFQYGRTTEYEAQVPLAPGGALGSGVGLLEVSRHLQRLAAEAAYHYRLVVVSDLEVAPGVVEAVTFYAPDRTFITQAAGKVFALPDERQWQLVSPPDKHGADLYSINESGILEASLTGDAITYLGNLPTESSPSGSPESEQMLSRHTAAGWYTQDISPPHASATGIGLAEGKEYRAFSEDLSLGLFIPQGEVFTPLAPHGSPPDTEATPYLRNDFTCVASPESCFMPLLTGAPGYADVTPGVKFSASTDLGEFLTGTTDMAHVLFHSGVELTSAQTNGRDELYEWSAGRPPSERVQLASVLPSGQPASSPEVTVNAHTISSNGSRVVWSDGTENIYMRDLVKGETIRLDVVQPDGSGGGGASPVFQTASDDGSKVFFTDGQRLTAASGGSNGSPDLYECEIVETAGGLTCDLSDLTPAQHGKSAAVQGRILGASEDGSWVYFVADGALSEHAPPGDCDGLKPSESPPGATCNLYVHHDGATRLIAVLSGQDASDWNTIPGQTARVSPDGHWLAFMSQAGLTGYNTRDAHSGQLDEEVYLYDASANSGVGSLVCASCNPTGARPVGIEYAKQAKGPASGGRGILESQTWVAANVPGWTSYGESRAIYQSRYLSDGGRLFFTSRDALVPQDINGTEDVYEYEPAGVGGCSSGSATFSAGVGGCVSLVSSGTGPGEASFVDASENGDDVFFLTNQSLVPQDFDTSMDVYDAHVCTAQAPCASAPVASPACTTADSCRAAPTPQPALFGAPSSATFSGAGNVAASPVPASSSVKPKVLTRAEKLTRALMACHRKRGDRRRVCERNARRRAGAKRSRKSNASGRIGR